MVETADRTPSTPTGDTEAFDAILLPVGPEDGDRVESLAATAAEVSGMMQTAVHVLHVFSPARFDRACDRLDCGAPGTADPDAVARRVQPVRAVTRALAAPLRDWGMPMTVTGRIDESPSAAVVDTAREIGAKRILVGGRRRTPTGKAVFGSTAQSVLLDAPCPVTFVRDD
jgi:nucleotide-binding universal stress UspA family protein